MKVVVLLACFAFAVVMADHDLSEFDKLVYEEVKAIYNANKHISLDDCSRTCDDMFNLINDHDEAHTDRLCQHFCLCERNDNCHT